MGTGQPAERRVESDCGGAVGNHLCQCRGHVLPGQRPGRLSAHMNPRGRRRTGHVPPRRWRPRLSAEAAILRRRRVTPSLPEGRTRSRCWPTLLHRGSQRPLHWQTAPAQVALHGPRPLLLRRGSRAAPRPMAPLPALACRARRSPLRRRSPHSACPLTADRAAHQPEQLAAPRPMALLPALACRARRSPLRRRSRHSACPLTADRAAHQPGQRSSRSPGPTSGVSMTSSNLRTTERHPYDRYRPSASGQAGLSAHHRACLPPRQRGSEQRRARLPSPGRFPCTCVLLC